MSDIDSPPQNDQTPQNWKDITPQDSAQLHHFYYVEKNIFGRDKLYQAYRAAYPNSKISQRTLLDWLKHQEIWQTTTKNPKKGSIRPILSSKVGHFQIDCGNLEAIEYNRYKYFVVATDILSKRIYAKALRSQSQQEIRNFLQEMKNYGAEMHSFQSDNGVEFQGYVQDWCRVNDVAWRFSKPGSPETNGQAERMVGVLKRMIYASHRLGEKNWALVIPKLVENLNKTGSFGAGLRTPDEIEQNVEESYEKVKAQKLKGRGSRFAPKFKLGDIVRQFIKGDTTDIRRRAKIGYFGKELFEIVSIVPSKHPGFQVGYRLKSQQSGTILKGLFPAYSLRLVPPGTIYLEENINEPPPDNAGRFEVEAIIDKRTRRSRDGHYVEYRVLWRGYPANQSTWERRTELMERARDAVQDYENTH